MSQPIYDKINELLKAVRNTQRNITIVCFVALASIWSFDGNDLETVETELQQIRSLASTWENDAVWLSEWAHRNTKAGPAEATLTKPLVFSAQDHGVDHEDAYKNPSLYARKVEAWSVHPLPVSLKTLQEQVRRRHFPTTSRDIHLSMPSSIEQFKNFWNDLGRVSVRSMSFDSWPEQRRLQYRRLYFAEDIDEASDVWFDETLNTWNDTPIGEDFTEVVLKLTGVDVDSGIFTNRTCGGVPWWCRSETQLRSNAVLYSSIIVSRGRGRGDASTIAIPVNAEEETLSARVAFRTFYANKTNTVTEWNDTDFEFAFPALDRYAKNGRETL